MIIKLEKPFSQDWSKGYLYLHKDGRRRVYLTKDNSKKITVVSYARYLMSVQLKRYLEKHEHVDHIDEDKTNDDPENLQILRSSENNKKNLIATGRSAKVVLLTCQWCNNDFAMSMSNHRYKQSVGQKTISCSRSCSRKLNPPPPNSKTISEEVKKRIKELRKEGLSNYKISEKVGVARNTVMKYWE